jgi:hypothetical protein
MAAPLRIIRRAPTGVGVGAGVAPAPQQEFKDYLERLTKMIPGEVIGLYLVGSGLIPKDQNIGLLVWSLVCLAAVVVVRAFGTADPAAKKGPSWIQVGIAAVAFVVWLYSMGGPFVAFGLYVPYVGSLLVLAWSFFVPYLYQGETA